MICADLIGDLGSRKMLLTSCENVISVNRLGSSTRDQKTFISFGKTKVEVGLHYKELCHSFSHFLLLDGYCMGDCRLLD